MAVQLIPGGIFLIGCFIIKESPAWLYRKGRQEEGLRNLAYLRNLPADHQCEPAEEKKKKKKFCHVIF